MTRNELKIEIEYYEMRIREARKDIKLFTEELNRLKEKYVLSKTKE